MLADLSLLLPGGRRGEAARRTRGLCSVLHATSHATCFNVLSVCEYALCVTGTFTYVPVCMKLFTAVCCGTLMPMHTRFDN